MSSSAVPTTRPRLTGRAGLLAIVVLLLGVSGIVPVKQYLAQREEMAALERKVELLLAEQSRLRTRIHKLQDPRELERLARECLGMVKPGEIAFVAVPEDGGSLPPAC
ncbi:MAG TPA: septum formation initiator family protein [Actinomycetota bacterium]|nr:septum formation initiator family protein [Actinomycetota bacterium]